MNRGTYNYRNNSYSTVLDTTYDSMSVQLIQMSEVNSANGQQEDHGTVTLLEQSDSCVIRMDIFLISEIF